MGETEASRERAEQVIQKIKAAHAEADGGPVFLGGNCLGMISRPGGMETFFVPEVVSPKRRDLPPVNLALVSQSGAFALVRMTDMVAGDPAYNITVGNQMDLTIGDFITYLARAEDVGIIAVYVEGFKDLDGLHACRGIRMAVENGKEVIVYKSGRTPEGKTATSGHTASVAGDYMVCTSCLGQAGALVTESHEEFDGLVNLAIHLNGKAVQGSRIAGISPAGFETVGIADSLQTEDSCLELARFSPETQGAISQLFDQCGLSEIMDIRNPLDLTPGAPDPVYTGVLDALAADDGVDALVTSVGSLAPATSATPDPDNPMGFLAGPESLVKTLPGLIEASPKPVVVFNDAGIPHQPINQALRGAGIPVFNSCSQAMGLLARYTAYRLRVAELKRRADK
ncbi:MAG: CoA-binding protein, partial [Desulfobacterales bacterium]|nr:CoA-binding protein [Desulfobacterales bacterium]